MTIGSILDRGPIFVVASVVAACSVTVERLPVPGESLLAESMILEAGGKGFNIAVAANRLGAPVDGVMAVGSDRFADLASVALADAGLPQEMLVRFPGSTGAGVGMVDRAGENVIAVAPGANLLLSPHDIQAAATRLREARFVVGQFEVGDAPILAAFAEAARTGATTILNPSPFRALSPELLALTDMLVVNQTEAAALARGFDAASISTPWEAARDGARLAQALFVHGIETLIVTLGAGGAMAWTASRPALSQPAFRVPAIDTIGAGDAFLGGLLDALSEGRGLAGALERGAACGALATTRRGLLDALPTRAELEAFLATGHAAVA